MEFFPFRLGECTEPAPVSSGKSSAGWTPLSDCGAAFVP